MKRLIILGWILLSSCYTAKLPSTIGTGNLKCNKAPVKKKPNPTMRIKF